MTTYGRGGRRHRQTSGTPTAEGTYNFTLQVNDTGPPVQSTSRALSLTITSNPGRNDSIETATPVSNGTLRASLSPFADPPSDTPNPDQDFYALRAAAGSVVTVETFAARLLPVSPADTVLELLDQNGQRFATCRSNTWEAFDQPCLNDDLELGYALDSKLQLLVPGEPGTSIPLYVRVLDWTGSARPDFTYDLFISGAE